MEFLYGFLSNISRDLVCGAVNQLRYPCCFNNFVEELAKEEVNLITTRDDVKDRIAYANKQTRKTAQVVHKWVEDANNEVDTVKELLEQAGTKQSWCFRHCPNWIWRYSLGRKLANKKKDLEKVINDGGQYFQREIVAPLPSSIPKSEKYLSFASRQNAYKELMEAVKDDEVCMIGLYGMGGCGKTTMAEEVLKVAEAEHQTVLFVQVSNTVEVRTIQDKIASSLQYTFTENGERERAKRLYMRLTKEAKILVILDDVWQRIEFDAIGIPSPEHRKGCKVLITTRSEDVCNSMGCRKTIHLPILEDDEAWTLFQKEANINEGTSDTVKDLARQISDECKGLPVAIAAVASTLKAKDEVIWKVALSRLRSSKRVDIDRGLRDPYNCLELSYHYLDNEAAKSLFLLCSVFPEDYEIPIELLLRCAIGLGIVGEVRSYEEARNEVIAAKIKLMTSCLLLDASNDKYKRVKMHDLIRDVAHLIAKNENKGIKCEVENDVTLEYSVRYLWCKKLPNDLDYSNLEFLYVTTEVEVLDEIFTRMGKLRVLILQHERRWDKLPLSTMSFKSLTNLRCLILLQWELNDISFIRNMKKLESLSLTHCSLPSIIDLQKDDAVSHLPKLKLLVLHHCRMERNIFEVIGRIPQLEELHIVNYTIEFHKTFSGPQTLQRYTIISGTPYIYRYGDFLTPNEGTLELRCFDISNEAIMGLAKKTKNLHMGNIKGGAKNIIPNIFQLEGGGMPELKDLCISYAKEIECLVDSSNHTSEVVGSLFSSLKILCLWDCPKLRSLLTQAITPNPVRYTIFQNLQHVYIYQCGELKYVFSANTVGGLPQLETLKIYCCNKLEEIVEDIIPPVANELEMIEENSSTPSAPLVNHSPGSFTMSKLTHLGLYSCPKLGLLFPASTAKTLISLEILEIGDCPGLKHLLTCERAHNNEKQNSVEDDHDLQSVISMFLNLKRLVIKNCDLLQHIFPIFHVGGQNNIEDNSFTLQHLKTLEITRCAKLEVIFPVSVVRCLPELELLKIRECEELKHIMEEDENDRIQRELMPCFPKLTVVVVEQCHKLKHLFSASASDDLPNLEVRVINGANEIEQLIGCEQREDEGIRKAKVELPKLKLLILMHLPHLCQGIELRVVKHRIINNCPKLSLTSTTTLQELNDNFPHSDFENIGLSRWELESWIRKINESNEVSKRGITSEIPSSQLEWDLMPENNSPLQMNQEDPTTSKSEQPSSQFNDNNQSILRNIAGTVHEHKQYESGALDFESNKVLALEREGKRIKTSSTGVEVISLGGIVKQDDKLNEGKTDSVVTRTRLEAYKQFVDLDDAQIALLEEAITAYPHLWNACQKFTERFQAWMLKTLADMLLFLQNESGHTVTPQREKEFHKLCDEAVELGFDRTWVDEMRQCVVARDPKLEENHAQESINELFKRSTGADMVPNSQVVEQGDGPNEHCIGTSQCQKMMQNVDNSIQEGFNLLIDKEGEIGVVSNDHIVAPIIEETKKFGLVDRQSNSEPSLMNQQKSLGEICLEETEDLSIQVGAKSEKIVTATLFSDSETRNSSPPSLLEVEPLQKNIMSVAEEGTISNNTYMAALSMHSKSAISQSGQLVTSQSKSYQHSEIESHPKNIEDFGANDIMSLFQPVAVEEHGEGQVTTSSIVAATAEYQFTKDNRVVEVLAELEKCLELPLKDIASSETCSLRLLTVLNFLSGLPFKDATLSDGLKDIIDSMHREFPSILCSFKKGFATTHKLTVLEAQRNKVDVTLVSKISEAENLMDEAQQKEADLKERVIKLKKEINDCEAALSSLQEENKKRGAETIGYKKELENVRKDKSQMVEDQRKVVQELLEVVYKWSVLCSKFELNRIVGRNPS